MSKHFSVVVAAVAFGGLMACGPGAKISAGKQGAAEALYSASTASANGQNPYGQPIDFSLTSTYKCREGGEATLSGFQTVTGFTGSNVTVAQQFDIAYKNCGAVKTSAGVATLNGTWTTTQGVLTTGTSVDVQQKIKGKILYQGAMDDYVDADIVQTVSASALTATSGGVSMVLKGSITDSSGTYTYDEAVDVTSGNLSVTVNNTQP